MHSSAWMNGQYYSQVGQPSQTLQVTSQQLPNRDGNLSAGSNWDNSSQYMPMRPDVPQTQNVHMTSCNGQMSHGSYPAAPQQAVSSHQMPTRGRYNPLLMDLLFKNVCMQSSTATTQSGSTSMAGRLNYVPRVATQQFFHQDSPPDSSNWIPPNTSTMQRNATYPMHSTPSIWNQQVPMNGKSAVKQDARFEAGGLQHDGVQKSFCQNANGQSVQPLRTYTTTAPSPQHVQMPCTPVSVSVITHSKHDAHNKNHSSGYRLNSNQHGFSTLAALPSQMSNLKSQHPGNNNHCIQPNVPSRCFLNKSDMCQKTENYRREATPSGNSVSNPHSSQNKTGLSFSTKTNGCPINSAAGTGQPMHNRQMFPGNTGDACKPYNAGSDCGPSPNNNTTVHPGKILQFSHRHQVTESSQTEQPVALHPSKSHNSNTSQSVMGPFGQAVPEPTQHNANAQPKDGSAPKDLYVPVTDDVSGNGFKAQNVVFVGDKSYNTGLKGALQGSLPSSLSQLHQFYKRITSQQKNKTKSCAATNGGLHEMAISSVKPNECSSHTTPFLASQKAVAVVQPLSQKQKQASSKTISHPRKPTPTDEIVCNAENPLSSTAYSKHSTSVSDSFKDDCRVHPEIAKETRAGACLNMDSVQPEDLSQNHLNADNAESKLPNTIQSEQCATLTAHQSQTSEVPVNQLSEMNKCQSPEDPNVNFFDLPSVPIVSWTIDGLTKLIEASKVEMPSDQVNHREKLKKMFMQNLKDEYLLKGRYTLFLGSVKNYLHKHLTPESIVLSELKSLCSRQQKNICVLPHDYVPPTMPYTSSWLNINDQLDDIDKEFGFPQSLTCPQRQLESDSQAKPIGTVNGIPAQIGSEEKNEALLQTELQTVESDNVQQLPVVVETFTQAPFSSTEIPDSSDPFYKFDIQILPQDEARIVHELLQGEILKNNKTDSQQKKSMNDSAQDELSEVKDVKSSEVTLENRAELSLEQCCCITKWIELISGSNTVSKCQCNQDSSSKDVTKKSIAEAEVEIQKEDFCVTPSHSKFDLKNEENDVKISDIQSLIFSWSKQCDEIINLTEEDNIPHSYSNIEPKDISVISVGSSQSSSSVISYTQNENLSCSENDIILLLSDSEEDSGWAQLNSTDSSQSRTSVINEKQTGNLSSSEIEIAIQMSDLKEDCGQAQLKPTGSTESGSSLISGEEIKNPSSSESEIIQTSDLQDDSGQDWLKCTDRAETPLNTEHKQKHISFRDESCGSKQLSPDKMVEVNSSLEKENLHRPTFKKSVSGSGKHESHGKKRKRLKDPDRIVPVLKKKRKYEDHEDLDKQPALEGISKRRKFFADHNNMEPTATNVRVVKLALFGSSSLQKRFLECRKDHTASSDNLSHQPTRPPEILTINVISPKSSPDTAPVPKYSVKQAIHEEWRKTFLPTKIKHRRRFLAQEHGFARLSKVEKAGKTNTEELLVCCERSSTGTWTVKRSLSLSRSRSTSDDLRAEKSKDVVTAKRPAKHRRSAPEVGNGEVVPPHEKNVLRFSVLPNTFNLRDGSDCRDETTDSTTHTPDSVEAMDKGGKLTLKIPKGTWAPHPEKKYSPLRQSRIKIPKTFSLFREFQKKYKEKTQPSAEK
ncbi:uncharacterized protein LOC115360090 [Myripristis murdjan]|uniref:uncharacterized protein LOC115360090 n=1 Tax=Myripristis murdjan TaxID=586833 RepID=UPI00117627D2|nr:uncharacterized protein LOC115360090 [Myripristis murdjan]